MKECERCGDDIAPARVKALPHATTCVMCQEQLEKNGHFERHRMSQTIRFRPGGEEIESMDGVIVEGGRVFGRKIAQAGE